MRRPGPKILLALAALAALSAAGCVVADRNSDVGMIYRLLNAQTTFKERTLFFENVSYEELIASQSVLIRGPEAMQATTCTVVENDTLRDVLRRTAIVSETSVGTLYRIVHGYRQGEQTIEGLITFGSAQGWPTVMAGDLIDLRAAPAVVALRPPAPAATALVASQP